MTKQQRHTHWYLGQPVAIEYRSLQRLLTVHVGEVLECHGINVLFSPCPLLVQHQPNASCYITLHHMHQPVLKQSQSFMGPYAHQTLYWQTFQGFKSLINSPDPACHLTRTIYVVRLHVHCETVLQQNPIDRHDTR